MNMEQILLAVVWKVRLFLSDWTICYPSIPTFTEGFRYM
jgi:hypothetical protein